MEAVTVFLVASILAKTKSMEYWEVPAMAQEVVLSA